MYDSRIFPIRISLLVANKNSSKERGYIVSISTLPTGKENFPRFIASPKRLPAAAIWYSDASSAKYLSDVKASSQACISSNMIRVLWGKIVCLA